MDLHHLLLAGLPAHSVLPPRPGIADQAGHVSFVPLSDVTRKGLRSAVSKQANRWLTPGNLRFPCFQKHLGHVDRNGTKMRGAI
jgi:hypothetical protein